MNTISVRTLEVKLKTTVGESVQILKWERECADIKVGESVQILKWERECVDIKVGERVCRY